VSQIKKAAAVLLLPVLEIFIGVYCRGVQPDNSSRFLFQYKDSDCYEVLQILTAMYLLSKLSMY